MTARFAAGLSLLVLAVPLLFYAWIAELHPYGWTRTPALSQTIDADSLLWATTLATLAFISAASATYLLRHERLLAIAGAALSAAALLRTGHLLSIYVTEANLIRP